MRLIASAIERQLTQARTTLEIPLKVPSTPIEEWKLQVEFEDRVANLRLVRSHFGPPYGEIEVRADERYIIDWLGMVTGASITVMKDETRLDELEKLIQESQKKSDESAKQIQETVDEFKKLKAERDELMKKMKEEQEKRSKKEPDYIG